MKRKSVNSGLIQTTVPKLFNKMTHSSKDKKTFKRFTKIISEDVIMISSDSESELDYTNEKCQKETVKRKLFSEENIKQNPSSQKCSEVVLTESSRTSNPIEACINNNFNDEDSSADTIIQDSVSYIQIIETSINKSVFLQQSNDSFPDVFCDSSLNSIKDSVILQYDDNLIKVENSSSETSENNKGYLNYLTDKPDSTTGINIATVSKSDFTENVCIRIPNKSDVLVQLPVSSSGTKNKDIKTQNKTPTKQKSNIKNSSLILKALISSPSKINQSPGRSPRETHNSPSKSPMKFSSPHASPSKQGSPKKPPVHRYLQTISELFETVKKTKYLNNLLTTEKTFLNIFTRSGPITSFKFICLKLYTFKRKWYNIYKFCQTINVDITPEEVLQLYKYLKDNCIVDTDYTNESLEYLLGRLSCSEVKDIFIKFRLTSKTVKTKEEMIKTILKYCNSQSTLNPTKSSKMLVLNEVRDKMEFCVKVHESYLNAFFNVYLLGTFTNPLFWDISDYFNQIMHQNVCFPEYTIQEFPVFYSRDEFLNYSRAKKYYYDLENAFTEKRHIQALNISENIFSELKSFQDNMLEDKYQEMPHLKRYTAKSVYITALSHAAKPLLAKYPLKVKDWLEYMIKNYNSHRRGQWYYHLTWIYMKYMVPVDYVQAANLIIEILKHEDAKNFLSQVQQYDLQERAQQLVTSNKKFKISRSQRDVLEELISNLINVDDFPTIIIDASAMRSSELVKRRNYVIQDCEGNKTFMSVENIALEHYINELGFTDGRHCEGRIIESLFALFFWDIIYNPYPPVTATFLSKIQQEPLDMRTPYFYTNRKDLIDKRLKEIQSEWTEENLIEFVKNNYRLHSHELGLCNINNNIPDDDFLEVLVNCIGRKSLSHIYERLIKSFSSYVSGMPDLLMWNIEKKTCRFIEVKGEGDRLSSKQKLWIKYLLAIGAEAEVCLVHSTGSKRNYKKEIKANISNSINNKKEKRKNKFDSISTNSKQTISEDDAFCPKINPSRTSKKKNLEDKSHSASLNFTGMISDEEDDAFCIKNSLPKKAKISSTSGFKRKKR